MNSSELLMLLVVAIPYAAVHGLIIASLFHLRRSLPAENRGVSRLLLLATAIPLIGPLVSSLALARLGRSAQRATAGTPGFRSDCGHAAGIAYGLVYVAATWTRSQELGLLSLALLIVFFCQMGAALRVLRAPDTRASATAV